MQQATSKGGVARFYECTTPFGRLPTAEGMPLSKNNEAQGPEAETRREENDASTAAPGFYVAELVLDGVRAGEVKLSLQ